MNLLSAGRSPPDSNYLSLVRWALLIQAPVRQHPLQLVSGKSSWAGLPKVILACRDRFLNRESGGDRHAEKEIDTCLRGLISETSYRLRWFVHFVCSRFSAELRERSERSFLWSATAEASC